MKWINLSGKRISVRKQILVTVTNYINGTKKQTYDLVILLVLGVALYVIRHTVLGAPAFEKVVHFEDDNFFISIKQHGHNERQNFSI